VTLDDSFPRYIGTSRKIFHLDKTPFEAIHAAVLKAFNRVWKLSGTNPRRQEVMVLDLGFLGDTVHLLPALWMVRQAYPQRNCTSPSAAHITSLMDCVPWVDHVWVTCVIRVMPRSTENWRMISRLRREKFDAVINLNGSDRSSWLTFLSGARERLGRVPDDGGPLFWRRMFTAHVECPPTAEPVYVKMPLSRKGRLPTRGAGISREIAAENLRAADISPADAGTYFHISPFTTADYKELPPAQLVEFIAALGKFFPEKSWRCPARRRKAS